MGTLIIWFAVLLPIIGPAITLTRRPPVLWLWAASLICLYGLLLSSPIGALVARSGEIGDGGGRELIYFLALLIGAPVNGLVLVYKSVTTVFHSDGYGP